MSAVIWADHSSYRSANASSQLIGSPARRQGDRADRAAGAVDEFEGGGDQDGAGGRELVEVAEAGEAEFAGAVHDVVAGEGRVEGKGLAGVGADRLHPGAEHVPLPGEEADAIGRPPGRVGAVLADV